jgi:DNA helicase HerA-like ATPase
MRREFRDRQREQNLPVCINLDKFVQRSSGVFGATGTGKSFLTRLVLAGMIQHNRASVMVLDMHNEYGFDDIASDTGKKVDGLRDRFPARVRVVGLGQGALIRGRAPDFNLEIAMRDIQPEDIEMLSRELNLKETTPTTLEALVSSFGRERWFAEFREMKNGAFIEDEYGKKIPAPDSVAAWANRSGVNVMAAEGLHSKLGRVFRLPYIVEKPATDTVGEIIRALEAGQHVILSFGQHESDLDYLLVSNLLTRRIRDAWEKSTNAFRTSGKDEPRPLVIAVEEAHKLLNREMAAQTTFSTIARELRKYYVTLLIVDQRPSQIYDEVMSQLGTRISGWLGDEDDIRAVLSGLAGREALRGMLARLQPKEEVLLLGWGVPMPLPVRSRRYDENFWRELSGQGTDRRGAEKEILRAGVLRARDLPK